MDNTKHDTIIRMFYMLQLIEPLIDEKGNEAVKKSSQELKAAIITYLYSCKMTEESKTASEQLAWTEEAFKYLHILENKIDVLNRTFEDWKMDK